MSNVTDKNVLLNNDLKKEKIKDIIKDNFMDYMDRKKNNELKRVFKKEISQNKSKLLRPLTHESKRKNVTPAIDSIRYKNNN